jgi:mRNA interferase MazF
MSPAEAAEPKRGEVWLISFGPSLGGEIRKTRPAVVVSNNTANQLLNRIQVLPLTSNTSRLYPAEAFVTLNGAKRKAMADQLATVSKGRLRRRLGSISSSEIAAVERVIRIQLGME